MSQRNYEIDLAIERFGDCHVDFTIAPAEPDVGIMSAGPDNWQVTDQKGNDVTDSLTSKEESWLTDKLCDWYASHCQDSDY